MKKTFYLFLLSLWSFAAGAQTLLGGKITDADTGEELIGANIVFKQDGNFVTGTSTDFDGNYKISISAGIYTIQILYVGFHPEEIENFIVKKEQRIPLNIAMKNPQTVTCGIVCGGYKIPLLQLDKTSSGLIIPDYNIRPMPTKKVNDIIITAPGMTFIK